MFHSPPLPPSVSSILRVPRRPAFSVLLQIFNRVSRVAPVSNGFEHAIWISKWLKAPIPHHRSVFSAPSLHILYPRVPILSTVRGGVYSTRRGCHVNCFTLSMEFRAAFEIEPNGETKPRVKISALHFTWATCQAPFHLRDLAAAVFGKGTT